MEVHPTVQDMLFTSLTHGSCVLAGLIPELFPEQRTTAMAAYNSAIYMGRALSFGAVILAGQLGVPTGDIGIRMVISVDPASSDIRMPTTCLLCPWRWDCGPAS
jgi:hypothetical protein